MRARRTTALLLALLAPPTAQAQDLAAQDPMGRFLRAATDDAQVDARIDGALRTALGASLTSFSLLAPRGTVDDAPRVLGTATGGILVASGVVEFFGAPLITPLYDDLAQRLRAGVPAAVARAQTERVWAASAQRETRFRRLAGWLSVGLSASLVTATALVATREGDEVDRGYAVGFGVAAVSTGLWALGLLARDGPVATALRRWQTAQSARPTVALSPWGAGASLTVRF